MGSEIWERTVVDAATGEVVGDIYRKLKQGPKEGRYFKLYKDWLVRALKERELSFHTLAVLMLMVCESRMDNEVLLYPKDIIQTLHIRERTAYASLKELEAKGYITKEGPGRYRLHDSVSWQGKRVRDYRRMR